jgi:hypothetical protein
LKNSKLIEKKQKNIQNLNFKIFFSIVFKIFICTKKSTFFPIFKIFFPISFVVCYERMIEIEKQKRTKGKKTELERVQIFVILSICLNIFEFFGNVQKIFKFTNKKNKKSQFF